MKDYQFLLHLLFAILFLPNALTQPTTTKLDSVRLGHNPDVGRYVTTRGFNIYYETYGEGEPLLIIHGNGGSINNFFEQAPFFSQHYHIILADSRDQGKSADMSDTLSYEMMADDLNALLDSLHLDSCYVIGWSDGGINGLLLAMRHPDKVKKLAITGANLWPDTSAVDPWIYTSTFQYYDTLSTRPKTRELKRQLKLLHLVLFEPNISTSDLKKVKCPTLVIGGDHDVILPGHTMLIAASIPKSYLWIVPNSGHSTLINYKNEFNNHVYTFFQKPYRRIEGNDRFN
jgi:pimeloyl-ACP methyl ester carboxylesterase